IPEPVPQTDPEAIQRFQLIKRQVKSGSHAMVFLGDSLTQKWDQPIWERNFGFHDTLNGGVNGDRTENLLWRIESGNLDGQRSELVVLLIGTNDIGRNRAAKTVDEGIRKILLALRSRIPRTRIL